VARLQELVGSGEWEARHAGLLGVKYVLAARPDAAPALLAAAYQNGFTGEGLMSPRRALAGQFLGQGDRKSRLTHHFTGKRIATQ
jgi:hypothetical protein